jgi:biotin carboxylase
MRSLVVLGGADGAITTLQAARRVGLRTICVDLRADAPAIPYADEFLNLSTRDIDRMAAVLSTRDDVAGVVSPASDVNLPAQFALAERLGLPSGLSPDALKASVDKGFFRDTCDRLGMPGPRFVQGTPAEVRAAASRLTYPVIVKPTDSSGGRGISVCHSPAELDQAVDEAVGPSAAGIVIIEEYLAGDHYAAEAIVADGNIVLFALGSRTLTAAPHFVTLQHQMPSPPELTDSVRAMLDQACTELGYRWGSLNADVLVTADGDIVLIELGARLGGNGSAELLGLVHGLDVTETFVRMAVGETVELRTGTGAHALFRAFGVDRPGKLVALLGAEEIRALPEVVELVVAASPGEHVEPYHRAGAKIAYVVLAAADPERLHSTLACVQSLLYAQVAEAL